MNWDAVGAVAELLAAAGVIASLIFIGMQVRQNTRSVRAATYDSLVRSNGEWLNSLINDSELAASFEGAVGSWADVEESERPRVMYLLTQLFRHWENAFFQQRQGTLDAGLWATWERIILSYFHQPGIQAWWQLRHHAYSTDFQAFLEQSDLPATPIRTTRQLDREPDPDRPVPGASA